MGFSLNATTAVIWLPHEMKLNRQLVDRALIKKVFFTCVVFCLSAVLLGSLPEIWFSNHLKKNWNAEENTLAGTKNSRSYRLCLVFALDGVPYTMVKDLQKEGYFRGFYHPAGL